MFKKNVRWVLLGVAIGLLLACNGGGNDEPSELITAKKINIVDDDGTVVISLMAYRDNQGAGPATRDPSIIINRDGSQPDTPSLTLKTEGLIALGRVALVVVADPQDPGTQTVESRQPSTELKAGTLLLQASQEGDGNSTLVTPEGVMTPPTPN